MKKRRFPLKAVLDLREGKKKQAEEVLGIKAHERDQAALRVEEADQELARIALLIGGDRFTASSRHQGWASLRTQEEICKERRQELAQAEINFQLARQDVIVASRDHELVVRLQDRWREQRVQEQAKVEELALDDFVMARRAITQTKQAQAHA